MRCICSRLGARSGEVENSGWGTSPPAVIDMKIRFSGYHSCWNQRIGVRHLSLWTFIRHMKDAQSELEVAFDAIANGADPHKSRLKWRRMEARIKQLKREYHNGQRRLKSYWRAVCHAIQALMRAKSNHY